jgi:DNA-binding transcriptional MerR regulator
MKIGELSGRTGASPRSLRYYEEVGLLTPDRGFNGYRSYDESDVTRVWQIRWLFDAGLSSRTVLSILPLVCGGGDRVELDAAVADQVEPTRQRIAHDIELLRARLQRLTALQERARRPSPRSLPRSA